MKNQTIGLMLGKEIIKGFITSVKLLPQGYADLEIAFPSFYQDEFRTASGRIQQVKLDTISMNIVIEYNKVKEIVEEFQDEN